MVNSTTVAKIPQKFVINPLAACRYPHLLKLLLVAPSRLGIYSEANSPSRMNPTKIFHGSSFQRTSAISLELDFQAGWRFWVNLTYKKLWVMSSIAGGMSLLSLLLLATYPANAETSVSESGAADSTNQSQVELRTPSMSQVTNVNQLSDVRPTDWAFQALQSLVERYGCIAGYPDGTFRGNRALTRYEFAAGLNSCLDRINELIATATTDSISREDLATLQKLQEDFGAELATLRGRVDTLEAVTANLEAQQFSTTTKLRGQVIVSVNAGGFDGDRIVDSRGIELTDSDPNPTVLYRAGLDLNTSFFGTDLLLVRLEGATGVLENGIPNGALDNAAGVLEPNFGSVLDYSIKPPTVGGDVGIGRLLYTFTPVQDFTVTIGPDIRTTDFVDRNSYANLSFLDFSTQAFVNNFILFPVDGPTAGAALNWNPGQGPFSVRALYAGADPANPSAEGPIISTSTFTRVLYPSCAGGPNAGGSNAPGPSVGSPIVGGPGVGGPSVGDPITDNPIAAGSIACGERGLFGDTYQGTVEVEFAPSRTFALRLQYSGGKLFDNSFDVIGANFELTLARNFGVFGRYGYGGYDDTAYGDIEPNYWMAGVAMRDLFQEGALAGAAVGQPFIASEFGNATQTNFEVFYNYPFSRNIQITPTVQVITNAANQDSNGTIVTGTLRTVLSF